ncbi:MAG: PulJ/GspJ family protein [Planctomycetota bacterium]|jgi:prepilin-type N-terminal cleavage/methylation domain-containing protein
MTPPPTHPRGFSLLEVLIAIGLLGVTGLMISRLAVTSLDLIAESKRDAETQRAYHRAVDRLRADVWDADSFSVPNPDTLLINLPDDRSALWLMKDHELERAESIGPVVQGSTGFDLQTTRLTFALEGAQLVITQRAMWLTNQKQVLWRLER